MVRFFSFRVYPDILPRVEDRSSFFPTDLSTAISLNDVEFWDTKLNIQWITATLETITPNHRDLQGVPIHVAYKYDTHNAGANIRQTTGEVIYGYWLDLDRYLIQFWESRSILSKIIYCRTSQGEQGEAIVCVSRLLPEATRRGIIDLAVMDVDVESHNQTGPRTT